MITPAQAPAADVRISPALRDTKEHPPALLLDDVRRRLSDRCADIAHAQQPLDPARRAELAPGRVQGDVARGAGGHAEAATVIPGREPEVQGTSDTEKVAGARSPRAERSG